MLGHYFVGRCQRGWQTAGLVPRTRTTIIRRDCYVGPGDMEQPPRRTADFIFVATFAKKTQKSSLRLLV